MSRLSSVLDHWTSFEGMVVADEAGDVQRKEMRIAFYGGAWAVLNMFKAIPESTSEEAAAAYLQKLEDEVTTFALLQNRGAKPNVSN